MPLSPTSRPPPRQAAARRRPVSWSLGLVLLAGAAACRSGQPASLQAGEETDDPRGDRAMVEGRWEVAVRLHRALLEKDPDAGLAMYHLGYSEGSLGRRREELRWYERALETGYRSPDLLYNLGLGRLAVNEPAGADSALTAAVEAAPDEPEFHYAAARASLARGREAEARARLERTLTLDPDHAEARAALAGLGRSGSGHAVPEPDAAVGTGRP